MNNLKPEWMECSTCLGNYPFTIEYFKPSKDCKFGLTHTCRECRNQYYREWEGGRLYRKRNRRFLNNVEMRRAFYLHNAASFRARRKALVCSITLDDVVEMIQTTKSCPCCGRKFAEAGENIYMAPNSISIDKLIPSKGYTIDNTRLICWRCNDIKGNASVEELEMVARWLKQELKGDKP